MSGQYVFDVEWAGGFHTPTTIHCIVAFDLNTETVYEFHNRRSFGPRSGGIDNGLQQLAGASRLLGHNIIEADLPVLKHLHGFIPSSDTEIVDTLILSRLLNPDRPRPLGLKGNIGPHSIEAWAKRLGREDLEKVQIEDFEVFTLEMLNRCRTDVITNVELYKVLCRECMNG